MEWGGCVGGGAELVVALDAQNNPILRVDLNGNLDGIIVDDKGRIIGNDGKSDGKVYVINTSE